MTCAQVVALYSVTLLPSLTYFSIIPSVSGSISLKGDLKVRTAIDTGQITDSKQPNRIVLGVVLVGSGDYFLRH